VINVFIMEKEDTQIIETLSLLGLKASPSLYNCGFLSAFAWHVVMCDVRFITVPLS
jgi:hypothetical protein